MNGTILIARSLKDAVLAIRMGSRISYEDLSFLLYSAMLADGFEISEEEAMHVVRRSLPRLLKTLDTLVAPR